jgi:hypothetical protein
MVSPCKNDGMFHYSNGERKVFDWTEKVPFARDFGLKGPIQAKSWNESKPGTGSPEPLSA